MKNPSWDIGIFPYVLRRGNIRADNRKGPNNETKASRDDSNGHSVIHLTEASSGNFSLSAYLSTHNPAIRDTTQYTIVRIVVMLMYHMNQNGAPFMDKAYLGDKEFNNNSEM